MAGGTVSGKTGGKGWIHRILRAVAVLLALVVLGLAIAWFALKDQITGKVLAIATERLGEAGLFLQVGKHHLSWHGGVVLEDLELFADEEKSERIASLRSIGLRLPLYDLIRGKSDLMVRADESEFGIATDAGELRLEDLSFKLEVAEGSLLIEELETRFQGLRVTMEGELQWAKDASQADDAADPSGASQPVFVMPDLSPIVKAAYWLEFPSGEPTLALTLKPRPDPAGGIDMEAILRGEDFNWKGMPFEKAHVQVGLSEGAVVLSEMSLDGFGGHLSGGLIVDYSEGKLVLKDVSSNMDPFHLVSSLPLGESVGRSMKLFRALGSTSVSCEEVTFDVKNFSRSQGVFSVKSPAGVGVGFSAGEIVLADLDAKVAFQKGSLTVDAGQFGVFGGRGNGFFTLPLGSGFSYRIRFAVSGVSLPLLGKVFDADEKHTGTMKATYTGGGASGRRSHYGKGRVDVTDGSFYSVPIFGGLRSFLQQKSSKFGEDVAGDLGMDFTLKDGVIRSSNLQVESSATMLAVKGEADHVAGTAKVDLQAKLKGVVGAATGVVSKILTIHGEGPFDAMRWSLAPLSVFDGSGLGAVEDGIRTATEKTGDAIQGVGDTLKKGVDGIFGKRPKKK